MAFLLGWIYLGLGMVASAVVELNDRSAAPFAYHGLLGFYMPMAVWGAYLNITAWFLYRALLHEERAVAVDK